METSALAGGGMLSAQGGYELTGGLRDVSGPQRRLLHQVSRTWGLSGCVSSAPPSSRCQEKIRCARNLMGNMP